MLEYFDNGMHTETNNVDKCIDCPFNPFREDDKDIYNSEDGENIEVAGE